MRERTLSVDELIVSVIIPTNFQRAELVLETINCIVKQFLEFGDFEILVIENNVYPTKELVDLVNSTKVNFDRISYIHESNPGLHNARHTGAREARGSILIFIDDDILPDSNWLTEFIRGFDIEKVDCAGGKVIPKWMLPPPLWIDQIPTDYLSLLDYGTEIRPIIKREGLNGCNFGVRKEILFDVGGFNPDGFSDPKMVWHRGDGEYGLIKKIQAEGKKVVYLPKALIYHQIPSSRISVDNLNKLAKAHSISSGYHYYRNAKAKVLIPLLFILVGLLFEFIATIKLKIDPQKSVQYLLLKVKFQTLKHYGWRLAHDADLRKYICQENYLEAGG